jgi:hypothetical protein
MFGRRYTGIFKGREIEVQYTPPHAFQTARLNIRVQAKVGTRMAMGRQRPLLDCRDCPRVLLAEETAYAAYAQDEEAARTLFADPAARAALDRLLEVEDTSTLYVQPSRLWFRTHPWRVNTPQVKRQLEDLMVLASAGTKSVSD